MEWGKAAEIALSKPMRSSHLPVEICDLIVSYVAQPSHACGRDDPESGRQEERWEAYLKLKSLRNVSAAFCKSVTPFLFYHVDGSLRVDVFSREHDGLPHLSNILNSELAPHVREVTVGLSRRVQETQGLIKYLSDLEEHLPQYLSKLPELSTLSVNGPVHFVNASELNRFRTKRKCLPLTTRFRTWFVTAIRRALTDASLPKLAEVRLTMGIPHDLLELRRLEILPEGVDWEVDAVVNVMKRIKRLHMCTTSIEPVFPHDPCFVHFFEFAQLATSAESLHIACEQGMDMDSFDPKAISQLRVLSLDKVTVNMARLIQLIEGNISTLQDATLRRVKLKSGTWGEVLDALSTSSCLRNIRIEQCRYGRDMALARFGPNLAGDEIYTRHPADVEALDKVKAKVAENCRCVGVAVARENRRYVRMPRKRNRGFGREIFQDGEPEHYDLW